MQREIENYIREKSYWPEIEEEVHRQVNAVKDQNPSLYAMDPLRVIREAEQRALAITGVKNKLNLGEARRKADEARRLASLNVKSKIGSSPHSVPGDMRATMEEVYDRIAAQ